LTDNRNRTASEVRHAFTKYGGNLGETGCVSFMFDRKGIIIIIDENDELDEDELTLEAIEAGAEDIEKEEQVYEISTEPTDLNDVRTHVEEAGYTIEEAEVTLSPQTYSELDKEAEEKVLQLIDMLEESEDVQDVHSNLQEASIERNKQLIAYIKGQLEYIQEETIVIDVHGIGYEIICPNPFVFQASLKKELFI